MPMTFTPTRHRVLPPPSVRLLSRVEAAAYVGISPNTFERIITDGFMPGPKRIYGRVLWDVRALDGAIDSLPGEDESEQVNPWD